MADLRSFPVGSYLLLYRRDSAGIELVRVIHGARDLPNIFSGVSEPQPDCLHAR
jgi:toxin ParE1/3/4